MERITWALAAHPLNPPSPVTSVTVAAKRFSANRLEIEFVVTGPIAEIFLPAQASPQRADGLWTSTCFEAFLRAPGKPDYIEINMAPSGRWASYRFSGYRAGQTMADEVDASRFDMSARADCFRMSAVVDLQDETLLYVGWEAGFSAVIEAANGTLSYWALRHGDSAPDFHNPDCFVARLAAPEKA